MADMEKPTDAHLEKKELGSDSSSQEGGEARDWTPEEERKLVWKIDLRVFPMLVSPQKSHPFDAVLTEPIVGAPVQKHA